MRVLWGNRVLLGSKREGREGIGGGDVYPHEPCFFQFYFHGQMHHFLFLDLQLSQPLYVYRHLVPI